jgi:hypothetical protein
MTIKHLQFEDCQVDRLRTALVAIVQSLIPVALQVAHYFQRSRGQDVHVFMSALD